MCESRLTGGEASPLVTASKLDVEVGDQSMDVVVPLHLQAEWRSEGQVLCLHCVDVHLLNKRKVQCRAIGFQFQETKPQSSLPEKTYESIKTSY